MSHKLIRKVIPVAAILIPLLSCSPKVIDEDNTPSITPEDEQPQDPPKGIEGITFPESLRIDANPLSETTFDLKCTSENIGLSCSDGWFGLVGDAIVAKDSEGKIGIYAEPNFSAKERKATITITG